jgi:hypothetical protein
MDVQEQQDRRQARKLIRNAATVMRLNRSEADSERRTEAAIRLGEISTPKKTKAARLNGCMPCHPGKKRGRPRKPAAPVTPFNEEVL